MSDSDLSMATIEELIDEIGRRCDAWIVSVVRDQEGNTQYDETHAGGNPLLCLGLAERARAYVRQAHLGGDRRDV